MYKICDIIYNVSLVCVNRFSCKCKSVTIKFKKRINNFQVPNKNKFIESTYF